jgi:hypothetical protein
MKLYKFRSFENPDFTVDILRNEQLYCAPYKELNDPFEGLFSAIEWKGGGIVQSVRQPVRRPVRSDLLGNYPQTTYKTVDELPSLSSDTRICSLSEKMTDVRMWSLYASGHKGCAIEIDFELGENLFSVNYDKGLQHFKDKLSEKTRAIDILTFKTNHWEYEKEYRIITSKEYCSVVAKITGVYLGVRISDDHKKLILEHVKKGTPVYLTKLNQKTVEIQPSKQIN